MEAKEIEQTRPVDEKLAAVDCWHLCQECGGRWEHPLEKYQRMIVHEPFCIFKKFAACPICLKRLAGLFTIPESSNIEEELYDPISTEIVEDTSPTTESSKEIPSSPTDDNANMEEK